MIAISTAYKKALIAYDIKGQSGVKEIDASHAHSENLLFSIDELLSQANLNVKENDEFAVVIGPGSFTGIRIGLALVKGLIAGGCNNKVVPLTTFELMAYSFLKNNEINEEFACVINALSGLYYVCKFDKNGKKIEDERVISQEVLKKMNIIKVGLKEENLCQNLVDPSGKELLELAKKNCDNIVDGKEIYPLYLRRSQAEDDLDKKLKN